MEKIWLKSYPAGVPAEINIDSYASLREVLEESCAKFGARPAYSCMGSTITFAELDEMSTAFGAFVQGRGLKKGARVALMMPNILQYPVCLFGILRAGCTVVNVNPLYTPRELEHQLADSGAEMIVVVENFAHTVAEVLPRTQVKHVIVTSIGALLGPKGILVDLVLRHVKKMIPAWSIPGAIRLAQALREGRARKLERVPLGHDDIAFLQYTGGTTGVAKGAMLLHRNIVANLLQAGAWVKPFLGEERHIVITPLPLYHIFSLTANCLVFMTLGAENVLIPNPRDIPGFVKEMGRYRFTAFTGVNTLFNALVNNAEFRRLDFSGLQMTLGGGMAVQQVVAEKWRDVTGKPLIEAYGLTETSTAATINPLNLPEYNGSIGLPVPSTDLILRDDEGNAENAIGGKAGDGRIRNSSWFHLRHHGRPRCDQMGFLFRLLAATGPDQPIAIRRANILSLTRIHDRAGTSSSHELRHRPRLHCGLDRRERRTGHPTRLSIPEQRRIRSCVKRWQLFVGDADYERLRDELSEKFLRRRHALNKRADRGRCL